MLITAVEPRRKAMCALYIDGEYVMNLDARTVIENRFDVGREFDDEDLHEIIMLSNERRATLQDDQPNSFCFQSIMLRDVP